MEKDIELSVFYSGNSYCFEVFHNDELGDQKKIGQFRVDEKNQVTAEIESYLVLYEKDKLREYDKMLCEAGLSTVLNVNSDISEKIGTIYIDTVDKAFERAEKLIQDEDLMVEQFDPTDVLKKHKKS